MEQIHFHFDPACPWAWLTSRWMARLVELGEVEVSWRFFSLGLVHLDPGQEPSAGPVAPTGAALQLLALARREGGDPLVDRLYTAMGRAFHGGDGKTDDPDTLDAALASVGLDPARRQPAMADPSLWAEVVADHQAAVASCQAFGVPTLILDGGQGPGAFGPVITEVPSDAESKELLRDVVRMLRRPYLFELKRDREGHPPQLSPIP